MPTDKHRVQELDLLRGIALMGILIINVQVFSTTFFLWGDWFAKFSGYTDKIVFQSINLLVCQRFIGIFSFLFGLGIAIQRQNFKETSKQFGCYFFRRTVVLALFGLTNLLFFFWGDILLIYSILSIILYGCMRLSNKGLLFTAFFIFLIPTDLYCIPSVATVFEHSCEGMHKYYTPEQFINTYRHGSILQMMRARVTDYTISYLPDIIWHRTSLTMMLIGFYIGRNDLHNTYIQYWRTLRRFLFISTPLCTIYVLGDYYFNYFFRQETICVLLNNVFILLSIFTYVLLGLALYKSNMFSRLKKAFINIGRLSLSNYFLQQILCAFIFHHYGLGLYFKTSPIVNVFIALGIFTFQLTISNLYLRKYRTGPLEWLWRKLAYAGNDRVK